MKSYIQIKNINFNNQYQFISMIFKNLIYPLKDLNYKNIQKFLISKKLNNNQINKILIKKLQVILN